MKIEDSSLRCEWQPIETYERDVVGTKQQWEQIICSHSERRWIRFGRKYPGLNRWYYSGTSERSQYAQVEDEAPTHWMPMMKGPWIQ